MCSMYFFTAMWSLAAAPGSLPLPKEGSSLRLPTGEPCPCRAGLDGAQMERSPAWRWDGAARSAMPRTQAISTGAPRDHTKLFPSPVLALCQTYPKTTCSSMQRVSNACAAKGLWQKHPWTTTITTEAFMDHHHHHACWSHPHPTQPRMPTARVSQPLLVLEGEDSLVQER